MKAILKRELQSYFKAVSGYVFVSVFMVFASYYFLFTNIAGLTTDMRAVFYNMLTILTFLVPVLTMRCLSEERKTKSDQILLTSSVSVWEIVLGKYFAAVGVFLIAIACTLVFPFILFMYGNPEIGVLITSYIGFTLVGCVFIAIGIFLSSLTENIVIAALSTFGVLLFVQVFDAIKTAVNNDFWVSVIEWVSLKFRYEEFYLGVFNFEHIIFYVTVAVGVLFLTKQMIEKRRWS
ncbi:MAG: ABC transporter [Ruminococcaceae bacterium]|nr:ABC transporter [Oscillospiraceae bacterium]